MKHPDSFIADHLLVSLTLAFVSGIAIASLCYPSPALIGYSGIVLLCFLALPVALAFLHKEGAAVCLLLPILIGIGWYHAQLHLQPPEEKHHIFNRIDEKTETVIIGTLVSMATFDGTDSQVMVAAEHLRFADDPDLRPTTGKLLLRVAGPWPDDLVPGDKLAVRATLKRPESSRTPGVFDYAGYLAQKDIWITGFVRTPVYLHRLDKISSFANTLRYLPERIRTEIGRKIDKAVPAANSGVYRAILIGDRAQVDPATLETFKGSGTMHILAISGLHMAVIGALLYMVFYRLLSRSEWLLLRFPVRKIAAFLSMPLLVCYGLLAGMNTPVMRAVIMSCVVIVAICTDRRKSPSTLLAFAAMIILALDPIQLYTASFQLSFAAVIGILFLFPALQQLTFPDIGRPNPSFPKKIANWLLSGLLVSIVATLATTPIALHFFNRFSLVGIAANLVVEPLICLWSLTAGFFAIVFLFLQPDISDLLLSFGSIGLDIALQVTKFFSSLPWSTLWLPSPALWLLILYYLALIGTIFSAIRKNRLCFVGVLLFTACCLIIFVPLRSLLPDKRDDLRISFLDVGQGSSTLLEYPSGLNILIDGGGPAYGSTSVGERIIAPLLWHKGIRKLDAIAITHPDADHYNGLDFIVRHFSPSIIWVRDTVGHDKSYRQLMELATREDIAVIVAEQGQRLGRGEEYVECIENLAIKQNPESVADKRQQGNAGIVLRGCLGKRCALFPGDIGRGEEGFLIGLEHDLAADFLLAPHHGSITSNSPEFLTAVSPQLIAVSAGRSGGGHFPHNNLVNECKKRRLPLMTTSRLGTLNILAGQGTYQVWGYARHDNNPLRPFQPVLLADRRDYPRKD